MCRSYQPPRWSFPAGYSVATRVVFGLEEGRMKFRDTFRDTNRRVAARYPMFVE